MSYYFTDFFRQQLFANQALIHGANIRLVFFRQAPSLGESADQWVGYKTTAELSAHSAWQELEGIPGYPMSQTLTVSKREVGLNNYVLFTTFPFSSPPAPAPITQGITEPAPVGAIGVEFVGTLGGTVNPLIFVTDTPTGGGTNVYPRDALTALADVGNLGASSNIYMFSWADPPVGPPAPTWTSIIPIEGPLAILRAAPPFEPSNTLHLWLYPQRANMIANPSFEAPGMDYWAPAGTRVQVPSVKAKASVATSADLLTLAPLPVIGEVYQTANDGHLWQYIGPDPNSSLTKWHDLGVPSTGAWAGKFTGTAPFGVESNIWPTQMSYTDYEQWTFQLLAKGIGTVKVGMIYWDAEYRGTFSDWGTEKWTLTPDAWIHIACVRNGPQANTAMMRIEVMGTEITIDNVLAERGALREWPYFDGGEKYGALDDYSWYGGSTRQGKSYSMWYSGRRSVMGRLFATPVVTDEPGDLITDTEVMAAGMVYNWIPAGVTVIPHIDVFYPDDLRTAPPLRSTTVLPYSNVDPGGVYNPWPPMVASSWGTWNATSSATISNPLIPPPPFGSTGGYEEFTVPAGRTTITVDAYGAQGSWDSSGVAGGNGGRVKCDVAVTPGEVLRIYVGQQAAQTAAAGFGGGGNRGTGGSLLAGSGGGATDIRRAPYGLADRLVIAPGGGGRGANNGAAGGIGGTPVGTAGANSWGGASTGGGPGTASAGGAAGTGGTPTAGALGQGGAGANTSRTGAGGGGGLYGGGGGGGDGSAGSGGGGGSGKSTGVAQTIQDGVRTGHGALTISW